MHSDRRSPARFIQLTPTHRPGAAGHAHGAAETRHNLQGEKVLLDQTIASIRALADEFALAEMHQLRVALHAEVHARGRNMIVASLEERSRKEEGDEVQASRIIFLRDALAARQAKLRAFKACSFGSRSNTAVENTTRRTCSIKKKFTSVTVTNQTLSLSSMARSKNTARKSTGGKRPWDSAPPAPVVGSGNTKRDGVGAGKSIDVPRTKSNIARGKIARITTVGSADLSKHARVRPRLDSDSAHMDIQLPPAVARALWTCDSSNGLASFREYCKVLESWDRISPHFIGLAPVGWYDSSSRRTGTSGDTIDMVPMPLQTQLPSIPASLVPSKHWHSYLSIFPTLHRAIREFPGDLGTFGFFLVVSTTGNWIKQKGHEWPGRHCYGMAVHRVSRGETHLYVFEPDAATPEDASTTTLGSFGGALQVIVRKLAYPRLRAERSTGRFSIKRVF
ncbi:hypothetical protein C8F01DRAFT_1094416, partial [Mycena amicta]